MFPTCCIEGSMGQWCRDGLLRSCVCAGCSLPSSWEVPLPLTAALHMFSGKG